MKSFGKTHGIGELDDWGKPEDLGAITLEGKPELFGRLVLGTFEDSVAAGIYRASKGKFKVTYPYHEHVCIIRGCVVLKDGSGKTREFGPGDSWVIEKGETIIWDVRSEDVLKTFLVTTNNVN